LGWRRRRLERLSVSEGFCVEEMRCLTEAFGGDRDDGIETCYCAEVDRVQSYLHDEGQEDTVDGYLFSRVYFAEYIGEGKTTVSSECVL
jgi:hypothetical protein